MKKKNTLILFILMLGNFAIGTGTLIFPGILFPLSEDLGISFSEAGQLVTFYALTYAIASPVIAVLAQKTDKKTMLVVSSIFLVVGYGTSVLASTYTLVVVGQMIAALGASVFTPTSSLVAVKISDEKNRTKAIGFVFAGFSLGTAIGLPVGSYLGEHMGWQYALGFILLCALISLFLVLFTVPKGIYGEPFNSSAFKELLKRKAVSFSLLTTVLQMTVQMTVFTFIALLLNHYASIPSTDIPIYLAIFGVSAFIGTFLGSSLADKVGPRKVIVTALIGLGLAMLSLNISVGFVIAVILILVIWGIMGFAFHPPLQAHLVNLAPKSSSIVLALNASAIYAGSALGSFNGSQIIAFLEVPYLTYLACVLAFIASATFYFTNRLKSLPTIKFDV